MSGNQICYYIFVLGWYVRLFFCVTVLSVPLATTRGGSSNIGLHHRNSERGCCETINELPLVLPPGTVKSYRSLLLIIKYVCGGDNY